MRQNIRSRFCWKENFPSVFGHTSVAFLKSCDRFINAKNGDLDAALSVARRCVKPEINEEIIKKYPNAVLLPVITQNRLPEALAILTGLRTQNTIRMIKTIDRKLLNAMERLVHTPVFCGDVTPGRAYIIVDDIVTQGGTVSALRKYVISHGGFVVAVIALAYSANSGDISPNSADILKLAKKFDKKPLSDILRKYRIAGELQELTNSQIKYLLRFNCLSSVITSLENALKSLKRKGCSIIAS